MTETPSTLSPTIRAFTITALLTATAACAQSATPPPSLGISPANLTLAHVDLPDAPAAAPAPATSSSSLAAEPDPQQDVAKSTPVPRPLPSGLTQVAGPYQITIPAGQVGPALTDRQKVISGLRDTVSPFSDTGRIVAAGYSHLTNGSPNYGRNSLAFGSRVGASFARGASQSLFTEAVLAPVLREDPRYYQMGSNAPSIERLFYAATRPLITRTNGGRQTPNFAQLGGYLGAAYLTRTYNPVLNQSTDEVLKIYGTSLGGAALGNVVREFLPGFLEFTHLTRFSHL